jgi:hypothetical protein
MLFSLKATFSSDGSVFCLLVVPADNFQPHKKSFTLTKQMQQMKKSSFSLRAGSSVQGHLLTWKPMKDCCDIMRRRGLQKPQKARDKLLGGRFRASEDASSLDSQDGRTVHRSEVQLAAYGPNETLSAI